MCINQFHSQQVYGHTTHTTQNYVSVLNTLELNNQQGECRSYYLLTYKIYEFSTDWYRQSFLGLSIKWDYEKGHVDISMLDYLPKSLSCFQHPKTKCPQYAPQLWTVPGYVQITQMDP